jgi:hypothetical protein
VVLKEKENVQDSMNNCIKATHFGLCAALIGTCNVLIDSQVQMIHKEFLAIPMN